MFWYLLQIILILTLTHIYSTKLTPDEHPLSILVFAVMATYLFTIALSFTIDLLRRFLWLVHRIFVLNPLVSQQRRSHPRIEVTKKVLPRH